MIKYILTSMLLAVMTLGAASDEAGVRAAVAQFNAAAKAGDQAALAKLLGDDLMYAHSSALVETKAQCIAALVKSKPNFVMVDGWTVNVYGKSAIVHGKMDAHNATGITKLHFMMMWVKQGNAWKMVGRHTARLPA
jgi:ketosteroid isomerase-like protein